MEHRLRLTLLTVAPRAATILAGVQLAAAHPEANDGATTKSAGEESTPATSQPMALQSLIPKLPNYSSDLWNRSYLTGDWGGERTELANHGILFDFDVTHNAQGNAHGGRGSIPQHDRGTWGLGYDMINMSNDLPPALGSRIVMLQSSTGFAHNSHSEWPVAVAQSSRLMKKRLRIAMRRFRLPFRALTISAVCIGCGGCDDATLTSAVDSLLSALGTGVTNAITSLIQAAVLSLVA